MAVESSPNPHFDLWIPAVETGLLALPQLVAWADEQIMRLPHPPPWLIELALATSLEGVQQAREYVPEGTPREEFDRDRIELGAMYLAFEQGRLPLEQLLLEAGQLVDCHGSYSLPECESFFLLLNEVAGDGPTNPNDAPLPERVRELFAPVLEEARAALVNVPLPPAVG